MSTLTLRSGHSISLLNQGKEFFPALRAAIDASLQEVRLETYIFQFDDEGAAVASALERAALRGVAVYLVMDGIGTPQIPAEWVHKLNQAGVHWHLFSPLGPLGLLLPGRWRRMHRKLCVVDGEVAFCGGINIVDDWSDLSLGRQSHPRFDFALEVRGPLVADVHTTMAQFWRRLDTTRQIERLQLREAARSFQRDRAASSQLLGHRAPAASNNALGHARAALVLRDNVRHRNQIEKVYRKALGTARHEVLIASAYFAPSAKIRRALMDAARRGVRVRLLLHGGYENFMQFHAARPLFGALLEAGVQIYEYQGGLLHAKVAVVDAHWMTVGSSNLDPLSLQLAREANVVVEDATLARALQQQLERALFEHAQPLDTLAYADRPWGQRQRDWLAYGLMRVILFLMGRRY